MTFILIMGILAVALFFGLAGVLAGILEHKTQSQPIVTIETPEQLYTKCCGCPNFACNKSYQEVLECSNRTSLS